MEKEFEINKIIEEFEKTLQWKRGGSIDERLSHVLGQYRQIADNSIFQAKCFCEDVKTQFKALEIITEGLTSDGLNHGQKRTIANHIITMLRSMVDRIDQTEFTFTTNSLDRFNFFRSYTPEGRLRESHTELKREVESLKGVLNSLKQSNPDIFKDEIPF